MKDGGCGRVWMGEWVIFSKSKEFCIPLNIYGYVWEGMCADMIGNLLLALELPIIPVIDKNLGYK